MTVSVESRNFDVGYSVFLQRGEEDGKAAHLERGELRQ